MVTLSLSCRQRSGSITPLAEIPRRVGGKLGGRRGTMKEREKACRRQTSKKPKKKSAVNLSGQAEVQQVGHFFVS